MTKKILMLPCIAAVAIATFVGKKTMESNAYENNSILTENVEALTQSTENNGGGGNLWMRTDSDCKYEIEGKVGSSVTLNIGSLGIMTLKVAANGKASYTIKDGKTDCKAGGLQMCQARYCPIAFWQ